MGQVIKFHSIKMRFSRKIIFVILIISPVVMGKHKSIAQNTPPNIIMIIADDLGVDALAGYDVGDIKPHTPNIDMLRNTGITFTNVWSTPVCTSTRASIISGKYGIHTGVLSAPGNLDTNHISIFKKIKQHNAYTSCVIGKWHISLPKNPNHPQLHGVDNYMGVIGAHWDSYQNWERTENGMVDISNQYATTYFTDYALEWIEKQENPWFLWMAHLAPHMPIHIPPDSLFTQESTNSRQKKYFAMIESLDHEVGRLVNGLSETELSSTTIVFIGDNGTPGNLLQGYPVNHGKGTLYEGGVRVPMIIAGHGVSRKGEKDTTLINVLDCYATIIDLAGMNRDQTGIYNSLSFKHLLSGEKKPVRKYNYTEIGPNSSDITTNGYTIRDYRYKLIQYIDSIQEFYDLKEDPQEFNNLLSGDLSAVQADVLTELEQEANAIRNQWSCKDNIRNGDEESVDCGGTYCSPCLLAISRTGREGRKVYPNPANDFITIDVMDYNEKDNWVIELHNLLGKQILMENVEWFHGEVHLNMEGIKPGLVIVSLYNSGGLVFRGKVLKK